MEGLPLEDQASRESSSSSTTQDQIMWLNRTQANGTNGNSEASMDQTILRSCKESEETLGVTEQKLNAGFDVQSTNRKNQHQMCGDANIIMEEEEAPWRTTAVEELSRPTLLMDKNQQNDVSSSSGKDGRDDPQGIVQILVSPSERDQLSTTSSTYLSSYSLQTRGNELADLGGVPAEDGGRVGGGRASSPSRTRIVKNYVAQSAGKEALLGTNAAEGPEAEQLHLACPACQEAENERLLACVENPEDCHDITMHDSQEELHGQRSCRNGDNDDYYDFIEEFLSEGALVNIDSAQTYVDLETGTVRTSVEVSAEDEGMEVKHEAEWVTQFVRSRKHK